MKEPDLNPAAFIFVTCMLVLLIGGTAHGEENALSESTQPHIFVEQHRSCDVLIVVFRDRTKQYFVKTHNSTPYVSILQKKQHHVDNKDINFFKNWSGFIKNPLNIEENIKLSVYIYESE